MTALPKLRTPEQVAEELGGNMTGFYVRQLIKEKGLPYREGRHRKVLMAPSDVDDLLEAMKATGPAEEPVEGPENPFGATARSAARGRRWAEGA